MNEQPKGWTQTKLGKLTSKIGSGATPRGGSKSYKQDGIPLVRSMNVHFDGFHRTGLAYIDDGQAKQLANVEVKTGDVLLNITGASIGRVTIAPQCLNGARVNQHVSIIRLLPGFEANYIRYFLASPEMQRFIQEENYGVTRQALTKGMIEDIDVPLPPLAEQRRIVAKLDSLFARTRHARAELAHIPTLVEHYKQAILAAAFRGDLTAEWRGGNPPKLSPDQNKQQIEEARCIAITRAETKSYKPALEPDWFPDVELPDGWIWSSVDQLTSTVQYGSSAKTSESVENGIPVLRMGNIVDGKLNFASLKYLPENHGEFPNLLLIDGDILFNRTNSAELVGKSAVYRYGSEMRASFASYLIRLQTVGILPELLSAYINSSFGRQWVASVASQQVGQANVNGTKLIDKSFKHRT